MHESCYASVIHIKSSKQETSMSDLNMTVRGCCTYGSPVQPSLSRCHSLRGSIRARKFEVFQSSIRKEAVHRILLIAEERAFPVLLKV